MVSQTVWKPNFTASLYSLIIQPISTFHFNYEAVALLRFLCNYAALPPSSFCQTTLSEKETVC